MHTEETITIEDGVPVPPKMERRPGARLSAVLALEPGQSVWLSGRSPHSTAAYAARARAKFPARRFTVRAEMRNAAPGYRVWRTE